MKQKLLLLLAISLLFLGGKAYSQGVTTSTITGKVVDEGDGTELVGANVVLKNSTNGGITDLDGKFLIRTDLSGNQTLVISFVGYSPKEIPVSIKAGATTDLGTLEIVNNTLNLNEIEVIASVATDRRTPVAVSTIKSKEIETKVGNQEFPEILRSTPSVYVTKQGGGFGDSRINVRGFDQRNTAVMINGIPVNDMENGWVYWSNWAGLTDISSQVQVQRGLGASKLAVSSVGGSINIITNAAEMKKGGYVSSTIGNDAYQKYGFALSTGLGENGWAVTVQGTHTRGDGYVDGTMFRAWSYFASVAKKINDKHSIHLTALGAPQWHNQRYFGAFDGVNIATVEKEGIRYNPQWGYKDGEEYSWNKNFYHKPKFFLNHYWTISDKLDLATSAYVSIGRGGGTGDLGRINGGFRTSNTFKNENGTYRWDDIVKWNQGENVADFGANKSPWSENDQFNGQYVNTSTNGFILRASMNEHNWYGVLSNLTYSIDDNLTLVSGIDARYYKGIHYRRVEDLLGADAYLDASDINNRTNFVTSEGRADGNKIAYYNDGLVNWLGLFAQLEYSLNSFSAFASLSGSHQGFKRIDYFLYENDDPMQESDWENFLGGTAKAGINYNINERNNVFINGGYFSRQPIFDNVFLNNTNEVNEDITNQNIYAIEAGYGYRSRMFSANLNVYNTLWTDRQFTKAVSVNNVDGTANFEGVAQLHQGLEADFAFMPVTNLRINGMASIGNWRYTENFKARIFDDNQQLIGEQTLFMEDVKVPDAAQTTLNVTATYEVIKGLSIYGSYYYADDVYADFDPANDASFTVEGNQAWKLPSYSLLDAGVSYNFKLGPTDCRLSLNINNLADEEYMSESESNTLYDPTREGDLKYGDNGSVRNRGF